MPSLMCDVRTTEEVVKKTEMCCWGEGERDGEHELELRRARAKANLDMHDAHDFWQACSRSCSCRVIVETQSMYHRATAVAGGLLGAAQPTRATLESVRTCSINCYHACKVGAGASQLRPECT